MKKIAKTGAAFGLAALTLASSLSMGAAANAAPTHDTNSGGSYDVQLLTETDGKFYGFREFPYVKEFATRPEAEAAASHQKIVPTGEVTSDGQTVFKIQFEEEGRCAVAYAYMNRHILSNGICDNNETAKFTMNSLGGLSSVWKPELSVSYVYNYNSAYAYFGFTANPENPLVFNLTAAKATSVDVYDRTAVVEGRAKPGATVAIKGGSTNKTVQADAETGEWTTTVRGLALGENPFTLETFDEKDEPIGSSEFTVDVPITPLSAVVKSTSVFDGTAVVEVTGTPGLSLDYQGKDVTLDRDGKATVLVDGLSQGANTVRFQQFEAGQQIGGDLEYDIRVTARNIVAQAAFDDRGIDHDAILSGTAEAQADITIVDSNGKVTTTTADADGAWSTPVTAPGSGQQTFEASQSIKGMPAGSTDVRLNYGNAVEITSPGNNTPWSGGDLTFRGDGQYTAPIEITEKGNDTVVASTVGLNNGTWTAKVTGVDGDHKHTFTATMRSKGNLTTTDTIVVNADKDEAAIALPLAVTNPDAAQLAAGYTPNAAYTFRGTGKPNSTITIENIWGTKFGTTTVDAKGTWAWTRPNMGTYTWTLNIIQDKGTQTEKTVQVSDFAPRP